MSCWSSPKMASSGEVMFPNGQAQKPNETPWRLETLVNDCLGIGCESMKYSWYKKSSLATSKLIMRIVKKFLVC